jgi:hypothetical protein
MIRGFAIHTHSLGLLKKPRSVNGTPGASGRSGLSAMFTAWLSQASSRYALAGCGALTRIKIASPPSTALSAGQTPPPLLVMALMAFASLAASTSPSPHAHDSSRHRARLFWKQQGRHICHFRERRRLPGVVVARAVNSWNGPTTFHTPWCEVRRLLIVPPPRPHELRDRAVGLTLRRLRMGSAR